MGPSGMTVNDVIGKSSSFDEAVSLYKVHNGNNPTGDDMTTIFKKYYPGSKNSGGNSTEPGALSKIVGGLTGAAASVLAAGETTSIAQAGEGLVNVTNTFATLIKNGNELKSVGEIVKGIFSSMGDGITIYLKQQAGLLNDINKGTGLTGQLSKDFREELTQANIELTKYGISFQEISQAAQNIVNNSGRFLLFNKDSFNLFGQVGQAYMGGMDKLVASFPEFEKVGIGATNAAEKMGQAGQRALELGLNSQKVTGDMTKYMGKLNEYGFKNGVDGLSQMVRKSVEFRQSLDETFKIAEKVMNPAGAVEFAAKMQMMGGAIGAFNDPIKLMYMSTNNVEGLQDALLQAAGNLATYNAEQGKFEINSLNIRRAHDMATELGMNYDELTKSAIAFQERASAKASFVGLDIPKEQVEFITNLSRMKDGKMVVDIQGKSFADKFAGYMDKGSVTLEQIANNPGLKDAIIKYQEEFKEQSPQKIIANQATDVQTITRYLSFLVAKARFEGGEATKSAAALVGIDDKLTANIVKGIKDGEVKVTEIGEKFRSMLNTGNTDVEKAIKAAINDKNKIESTTKQKDIENHEKESKAKENSTTQNNNNGDNKMTVDLNIKAPNLTDGWTRETIKNSSIMEGVISSNPKAYTSPNK
jgi:hypothetical protein